jgi:hypothetical protein
LGWVILQGKVELDERTRLVTLTVTSSSSLKKDRTAEVRY